MRERERVRVQDCLQGKEWEITCRDNDILFSPDINDITLVRTQELLLYQLITAYREKQIKSDLFKNLPRWQTLGSHRLQYSLKQHYIFLSSLKSMSLEGWNSV